MAREGENVAFLAAIIYIHYQFRIDEGRGLFVYDGKRTIKILLEEGASG